MLIRNAEINLRENVDVRIEQGRIADLGSGLAEYPEEAVLDARGGCLLPGLNDHHLHLFALAASQASLHCGPPQMQNAEQLSAALRRLDLTQPAGEWIRGIGYHDSVAGNITREWLDERIVSRPVRIQHRSGRLWILNSCALDLVELGNDDPLERVEGRCTGRLYDADAWLRSRLKGVRPSLHALSRQLAGYGVTGLTDTTPNNGPEACRHFADAHKRGELLQSLQVMGDARLDDAPLGEGVWRGAHKFHLHETELPELDLLSAQIRRSHEAGRNAAFHCVTRTELVFALAALEQAGVMQGDRIEHAAVTPPELLTQIADLRLTVVTQPHFIAERGDRYLQEVALEDQPWLYRLQGFLKAGVALAGGTDAPFGDPNPWQSMQAAVTRQTADGQIMGSSEALTPEQALSLFISPLSAPGRMLPGLALGQRADLCLLARPWREVRRHLGTTQVSATFINGIHIKNI